MLENMSDSIIIMCNQGVIKWCLSFQIDQEWDVLFDAAFHRDLLALIGHNGQQIDLLEKELLVPNELDARHAFFLVFGGDTVGEDVVVDQTVLEVWLHFLEIQVDLRYQLSAMDIE